MEKASESGHFMDRSVDALYLKSSHLLQTNLTSTTDRMKVELLQKLYEVLKLNTKIAYVRKFVVHCKFANKCMNLFFIMLS